jgi:hypothetical protein
MSTVKSERDTLDAVAQILHHRRRADECRGAVRRAAPQHGARPGSLEHQPSEMGGRLERFEVRILDRAARLEAGLEHRLHTRIPSRHAKHDGVRRPSGGDQARLIACGNFAQTDGPHRQQLLQLLLEDDLQVAIGGDTCEPGHQGRQHVPQIHPLLVVR